MTTKFKFKKWSWFFFFFFFFFTEGFYLFKYFWLSGIDKYIIHIIDYLDVFQKDFAKPQTNFLCDCISDKNQLEKYSYN